MSYTQVKLNETLFSHVEKVYGADAEVMIMMMMITIIIILLTKYRI